MIGYYVRIDEAELADLVALATERSEEGIDDELSLLMADEERCVDIDKAWHGIQVMLADTLPIDPVLGGTAINDVEMAHLPVRCFGAAQVAAIHASLAGIDLAAKTDIFAQRVLGDPEVYPGLSEIEDINYLDYYFEDLKKAFAQAAREGSCMLAFIN